MSNSNIKASKQIIMSLVLMLIIFLISSENLALGIGMLAAIIMVIGLHLEELILLNRKEERKNE